MKGLGSSVFARKPVETLLREVESSAHLRRVLGPLALTCLGIGATIGTGIFVLVGKAARDYAGPSLMLSFLLAGAGCAFAALCYAELASMVPVAGSAYTYAYATLGELIAWVIGWALVLEYSVSAAAVAQGWANYFAALIQSLFGLSIDPRLLSSPWDFDYQTGRFVLQRVSVSGQDVNAWFNLPAAVIVLFLTVILLRGIKESSRANAAMLLLNLAIIAVVIGLGQTKVEPANWRPFLHETQGWKGVATGASLIFFAFIGFDATSTYAEEARNPRRDLAIGILASLAVCTILYVAMTAILTGMVPYRQIDVRAPFAVAFREQGLAAASNLISLGVLAGTTNVILVGMLSQTRVLLAMARDGMLPPHFFAAIHPRFQTPWKSTILVGLLVALASSTAPLELLAELVNIGTLFAFVIVCAAVWILRHTRPEIARPFRTPAVRLVSTLGIALNSVLILSLGWRNWLGLGVWLAIGLAVYLCYSRHHTWHGKDRQATGSPPA